MTGVGLVLLAAGYGTRLARDIASTSTFEYLSRTPKPLLPLGGRVLLSHWVEQFSKLENLAEIVVVTNDAHFSLYEEWAKSVTGWKVRIVSDGSVSNDTRKGAVAGMKIGVGALSDGVDTAVIVAGDTLLPSLDSVDLMGKFDGAEVAICAYALSDPTDCVRRGMLRVDSNNNALELVEKPASVAESPSNLACAPIYLLRRKHWCSFSDFLIEHSGAELKQRDAPGFWVRWVIPRINTRVITVADRIDIGGLAHYREALSRFSSTGSRVGQLQSHARTVAEPAVGRAYPRAGFLGNPSDGYKGKTIGLALASEGYAEVVATSATEFKVCHNDAHELPSRYANIDEFSDAIHKYGVDYGARRLVVAAAACFARTMKETKCEMGGNCELSYSTTIPARLGLAGSSALILATFRALARFHNTSLSGVDSDITRWPVRTLAVEREMLDIAGGLMDRVAQVYQGCVFMNFSGDTPTYERLDTSLLPPLWIAYRNDNDVGECSGKVHCDLGQRFRSGDEAVLEGMQRLGGVAEQGRAALTDKARTGELAELFRTNFQLRLELMGEDAVGAHNVRMVRTANDAGFAAKLCGSGGAVICVPDPVRELSPEEEQAAVRKFDVAGLVLHRVSVLEAVDWQNE